MCRVFEQGLAILSSWVAWCLEMPAAWRTTSFQLKGTTMSLPIASEHACSLFPSLHTESKAYIGLYIGLQSLYQLAWWMNALGQQQTTAGRPMVCTLSSLAHPETLLGGRQRRCRLSGRSQPHTHRSRGLLLYSSVLAVVLAGTCSSFPASMHPPHSRNLLLAPAACIESEAITWLRWLLYPTSSNELWAERTFDVYNGWWSAI